jgi:ribosome biogenesis GTPase / thiamine phosphate phosphatase
LQTGLVYKSTGSWYLVHTQDGKVWQCRVRGKLKLDLDITSTNPVAVGDTVFIQIEDETFGKGMITGIETRRNYVVRESSHNKNLRQIIASNLDQAILIATIQQPKTSLGFIDRFLISCEAQHVPAIIWFNKSDVLDEDGLAYYEHVKVIYEEAGYKVYLSNNEDEAGQNLMHELLRNKKTLISGHSGVGKSTLINLMIPGLDLHTLEVSESSGKGMHTTTYAQMYDLPTGGKIIDTPGIRELGVIDIKREELHGYFPEMRKMLNTCKFDNCIHVNEPQCAVLAAVASGHFAEERYLSYLGILESIRKEFS